jgi:hypothetical protein
MFGGTVNSASYIKYIILLLSLIIIFFLITASLKSKEESVFIINQLSYKTTCAEEDNVMLKINSVNKNIQGVNILPRRPIFTKSKYEIFQGSDYSGCSWESTNYENVYYYPKCIHSSGEGYIDKTNVCRLEDREKVLSDDKWDIVGDRGVHWQPFMQVINQDDQSIGEYKSLTIARSVKINSGYEHPHTIAVIYSDGYLRPTYFVRENEPGGWGGSFILGDSKFVRLITDRFYNNIKQIRITSSTDETLNLELLFVDNADFPAKLVFYYDYNKRGIDFSPSQNKKNALLTFVSMYRDNSSFDIEILKSKQKNKELVYHIMDPLINNAILNPRFLLAKDNPSLHSTLAPDFEITGIFED